MMDGNKMQSCILDWNVLPTFPPGRLAMASRISSRATDHVTRAHSLALGSLQQIRAAEGRKKGDDSAGQRG
jgi:hypothetical protein